MQETTISPITIVPPICAAKGERHPKWVALTLPVELAHCEGDIDEISEADGIQYNFWSVVNQVSDDINQMANFNEAEHWPPEALTTAATCFLMVDAALRRWNAGNFEECLVTAHAAQQAGARLEEMLKDDDHPKPQLQPNSAHVSLRGVPVGEPIFRECDHEELGWGCQGKIRIEAGGVGFTAYRFLTDREK